MKPAPPVIRTGRFVAPFLLAHEVLGYQPEVSLEDGLVDLAAWLDGQTAQDNFPEMRQELASRGLVV